MSLRDFAVVILIWVPAAVNAVGCPAPTLANGYFQPDLRIYAQYDDLFYACERDFRPDRDGWWAVSTCTDGTWSPVPKCIGLNQCIPPIIAKGEIERPKKDYYEVRDEISINCEIGYHSENLRPVCWNGNWSPPPSCKENQCGAIPKILNGDAEGSGTVITYTCHHGYIRSGASIVHCLNNGIWSSTPVCEDGQDHPALGSRPDDATVSGGDAPVSGGGAPVSGGGAPVSGGGAPLAPSREESPIERCGRVPAITNALKESFAWSVQYTCRSGYKSTNSVTRIFCYSDGTWSSPLPHCRECSYYERCW